MAETMNKSDTIKRLRKRLLILLGGLMFSYAITFGIAIFLFADAGVFDTPWGWPVIAGFAVVAFIHLRSQFRRYDAIVRVVEESDDD